MQTVTSFPVSAVPRDHLGSILEDYLALDRARIVRRRLVRRFGLLALAASVAVAVSGGLAPVARLFTIGLFLLPLLWAWGAELRLERRLSLRLDGVEGVVTNEIVSAGPDRSRDSVEKVIKSS